MEDFFSNTKDWIYIIAVVVAFFIFLGWNRKQQANRNSRKRRDFKKSFNEKKKDRDSLN
ncbi:hypothetical protein JCM19294_1958 [Nonlabens tegetincola]|uniref:Uncharacterized protein n=1 Tax=Nonlabens tegetincola TaxID=323273 RepID=A0A090Q084_9FLAO|nr:MULTISPECIES: hypothetical protein [Nonlabens]MEE2802581.1 hypothetical protein [Bacteroidota bacterium]GAK96445.1 hypothetical protein JCM19294_1958 [Nonlabens tegetincola]